MTILRDLSVIWSLFHVLVMFVMLFESRYPRKKTRILTVCFMGPLILFDTWFFLRFGPAAAGQALLLICTLPSIIFFFILANHRDGRFFFTFCLADTVALEITYITNLLDYYLPGDIYLVMFLLRLIAFPLLEWALLKWLRGPYIRMQEDVKKAGAVLPPLPLTAKSTVLTVITRQRADGSPSRSFNHNIFEKLKAV